MTRKWIILSPSPYKFEGRDIASNWYCLFKAYKFYRIFAVAYHSFVGSNMPDIKYSSLIGWFANFG